MPQRELSISCRGLEGRRKAAGPGFARDEHLEHQRLRGQRLGLRAQARHAHLVAHRQPARRLQTAAAGCAGGDGHRLVLHVPGRPVEDRLVREGLVAGRAADQPDVVHLRRVDDLARVEQLGRNQLQLDGAEGLIEGGTDLPAYPLAAAQPVGMVAAELDQQD